MKLKMLVVEDNMLTQAVLSAMFERLGFDVGGVTNGNEAIPFLEKNKVDVVILDLELPGMFGDEIYAKMQERKDLKDIPVIPFSAHSDESSFGQIAARGVYKLPETIIHVGGAEQIKDTNDELIAEVAKLLRGKGVSLPPEFEAHLKGQSPEKQ